MTPVRPVYKPEIPVPPLQPDDRMEACVLLGTGSSAKTCVFLCVSVNEGAIVDSGRGRLMGDHGLLVGVLMAARGRSMGVDESASHWDWRVGRGFCPAWYPLVGRRIAVSHHPPL